MAEWQLEQEVTFGFEPGNGAISGFCDIGDPINLGVI